MTPNATSAQESDASDASQQPTTDAGGKPVETVETVHSVGEWRLSVRDDGSVECANERQYTTKNTGPAPRVECRYGLSIEQVLARYAHETRFDRDLNTDHGAALRREIIDALRSSATDATCGRSECDGDAAYVRHVNAPTGPSTALVCDECATEGTYVTLYALENLREREVEG